MTVHFRAEAEAGLREAVRSSNRVRLAAKDNLLASGWHGDDFLDPVELLAAAARLPACVEDVPGRVEVPVTGPVVDCHFRGFDYLLGGEVIARTATTAHLTKHLAAYGGPGTYEGERLGRVLRVLTFLGRPFARSVVDDIAEFLGRTG